MDDQECFGLVVSIVEARHLTLEDVATLRCTCTSAKDYLGTDVLTRVSLETGPMQPLQGPLRRCSGHNCGRKTMVRYPFRPFKGEVRCTRCWVGKYACVTRTDAAKRYWLKEDDLKRLPCVYQKGQLLYREKDVFAASIRRLGSFKSYDRKRTTLARRRACAKKKKAERLALSGLLDRGKVQELFNALYHARLNTRDYFGHPRVSECADPVRSDVGQQEVVDELIAARVAEKDLEHPERGQGIPEMLERLAAGRLIPKGRGTPPIEQELGLHWPATRNPCSNLKFVTPKQVEARARALLSACFGCRRTAVLKCANHMCSVCCDGKLCRLALLQGPGSYVVVALRKVFVRDALVVGPGHGPFVSLTLIALGKLRALLALCALAEQQLLLRARDADGPLLVEHVGRDLVHAPGRKRQRGRLGIIGARWWLHSPGLRLGGR